MTQNLIIASDIHVAKVWDKIDKILPKNYAFLNPNTYFKKLIKKVKKDEILILNGDLVDYYYADYYPKEETNWDYFYKMLKQCKGKYYCNLGNHDFKSHPYNFRLYGLEHVNISRKTRELYKKEIGFQKLRYFNELKCIMVDLQKFNTLKRYVFKRHYSKRLRDKHLIFLNTGPEAGTKFRNYFEPKNWSILWQDPPAAQGLSIRQLHYLWKQLRRAGKRDVFIFIHTPAFFSMQHIPPIKLKKQTYWKKLRKYKLNTGVFLRNNKHFINMLVKSKKNITVISSHIHLPKQYVIEKGRKLLRESSMKEINKLRRERKYIKFISTPPLGGLMPYNMKLGYLSIGKTIKYNFLDDYSEKYLL